MRVGFFRSLKVGLFVTIVVLQVSPLNSVLQYSPDDPLSKNLFLLLLYLCIFLFVLIL